MCVVLRGVKFRKLLIQGQLSFEQVFTTLASWSLLIAVMLILNALLFQFFLKLRLMSVEVAF